MLGFCSCGPWVFCIDKEPPLWKGLWQIGIWKVMDLYDPQTRMIYIPDKSGINEKDSG